MRWTLHLLLIILVSVNSFAEDNVSEWLKSAQKALDEGKYQTAISNYTKVIQKENDNIPALYNRGLAYLYDQKPQKAIQDFSVIIKIDSTNPDAYNSRGLAYSYINNLDDAIPDFNKAIELDKKFEEAFLNRGSAYLVLKNYYAAVDDFDKVINIDKKNKIAFFQRATCYYKLKDYKNSIKDAEQAKALKLRNRELYYMLGNAYFHNDEFKKSVEAYTVALALSPDDTEVLNNRAMAYDKANEPDKALKDRIRLGELAGNPNMFLPVDSLNFIVYSDPNNEMSIEMPENWNFLCNADSAMTEMVITFDTIQNVSDPYVVGVKMVIIKNMEELYDIWKTEDLIGFWRGSTTQNANDYFDHDLFMQRTFKTGGYRGFWSKTKVQLTRNHFPLGMYEGVLAKDHVMFYFYMQAPEIQISYYEQIFERAIKTITLK